MATRYSRSQFALLGLLPVFNTLGLLLYGLNLATSGAGGAGRSLPALLVVAGLSLLSALPAVAARGRDVGMPGWGAVLGAIVATGLGPLAVVFYAYLAFSRSNAQGDRFGPLPRPAGIGTWLLALCNLIWPWMAVLVASRTM